MDNEVPRLKAWRTIRSERPLSPTGTSVYNRLTEAERLLEPMHRRRGISETALGDAIEVSEAEDEDDVYLAALSRYVAELGGHIEVSAVFPEEEITLHRTRS